MQARTAWVAYVEGLHPLVGLLEPAPLRFPLNREALPVISTVEVTGKSRFCWCRVNFKSDHSYVFIEQIVKF